MCADQTGDDSNERSCSSRRDSLESELGALLESQRGPWKTPLTSGDAWRREVLNRATLQVEVNCLFAFCWNLKSCESSWEFLFVPSAQEEPTHLDTLGAGEEKNSHRKLAASPGSLS